MASIRTGIELNDQFSSVIYSIINSVNMAVSSMADMQQAMNADIDTTLTADDRIESVEDFEVTKLDKRTLLVKFKTVTSQGDEFTTESEVEV